MSKNIHWFDFAFVCSFSNLIRTVVNRLSHPIFPCIGNKQRFPKLSRPLSSVAHALHRLSLPPPGQPPTSSPCVCPSRRQSGGAALNFSKNKTFHLAEFPEFEQSFNKIKWSEKELQTERKTLRGNESLLNPANLTRRHHQNS